MSACSRRNIIQAATAGLAFSAGPVTARNGQNTPEKPSPKFCLNTATIRGQNLPLDKQFKLAKQAGYDGIEPWLGDMDKYKESGHSLQDLGKWAQDNQISVEGCIGFPEWLSNDPNKRKNSLEQLKKDLEKLVALGCKRIAAPPAGATQEKNIPLAEAASRFNPLARLCLGAKITPLVEIWGFSSAINRLGDALYIAAECGESNVSVLADVYHLRKGGSGLTGLKTLGHHSMQIFHVNDYPARIAPKELNDADRVFPGDGSAPWMEIQNILASTSPNCVLSLELFNRDVWKMDPAEALKIGLEKMKSVATSSN
jgi:sugar phosphate isomerase/epimerase